MSFVKGTYGFDSLSIFLLILSVFLNFGDFTRFLSLGITIIVVFRAFSKNTYKRSLELNKFLELLNKVSPKFAQKFAGLFPRTSLDVFPMIFNQIKQNWNAKKAYKIIKCPKCSQKLRLPKGKGKVVITCKKCAHEFKSKI